MTAIFDYLDYREFLTEFYKEQKRRMPYYSYRLIGHSVGMDPSFVIKVLQGALHINNNKIDSFKKLCKLSGREATYFETLVHFNKAKDASQRKLYLDTLLKISRVQSKTLSTHQFEFFRKWYYSAVWALIQMKPRIADHEALASLCCPPITPNQAEMALELLLKLQLIRYNDSNLLEVTENNVGTPEKWSSEAISEYQQEMIALAAKVMQSTPRKHRDVSTVTVTIPHTHLEQLREMTSEFRKSVIALANELPDPDRAFQLNIQIFPLTAREQESDE